jgi:Xaa-Pro aminopeptidase
MSLLIDRSSPNIPLDLADNAIDRKTFVKSRYQKIQRQMQAQDIPLLLLTDPINIRYAMGLSIMPLWKAVNLARYAVIPKTGEPVMFEYPEAMDQARRLWGDVRPTSYWQFRFDNSRDKNKHTTWAEEIKDIYREKNISEKSIAVDGLDGRGFNALVEQGLQVLDGDAAMQGARLIKTNDELQLMQMSSAITEAALFRFENAIRPGISERELLATFWHELLRLGGEWCYTRLVASGSRTNPWFQEASAKIVRPGDLVAIDTDVIGPDGYACDISRTFLCGDAPTLAQKEAYRVAHDFVTTVAELCTCGKSYEQLARELPKVDKDFIPQRYPVFAHGLGVDDEFPFIPFPDKKGAELPEGELKANMVLSIEFYAGKQGAADGVKLEDQIIITEQGPVLMSSYPYDQKFF